MRKTFKLGSLAFGVFLVASSSSFAAVGWQDQGSASSTVTVPQTGQLSITGQDLQLQSNAFQTGTQLFKFIVKNEADGVGTLAKRVGVKFTNVNFNSNTFEVPMVNATAGEALVVKFDSTASSNWEVATGDAANNVDLINIESLNKGVAAEYPIVISAAQGHRAPAGQYKLDAELKYKYE